jgi:EAL domain-containing protein (putative c-di-GMP-specific phosphodiesterase class I)/GGDEF domain-containing protein
MRDMPRSSIPANPACESLTTVFQPIVALRTRSLLAYEALTRGPAGTLQEAPERLFADARSRGALAELEIACLQTAVASAARLQLGGQLFLNVSPDSLLTDLDWPALLGAICDRHRIERPRCVLELTEQSLVADYEAIRHTLRSLRNAGFRFAIDDFGTGYSGLRMWSELRPEFVKIDRYFVAGVHADPVRLEFVSSIVDMARAAHSHLIAEGVESEGDCRELVELGIDAAQGYLLGGPTAAAADPVSWTTVLESISACAQDDSACTLATAVEPTPGTTPVREFIRLVHAQEDREAYPVVDAARQPIGMVWRDRFLLSYSRPLHAEILNKKTVRDIMDDAPLVVDGRQRLDQVSRLVTRHGRRGVQSHFVVAQDGRYLGLGRTVDLLHRITEQKLTDARQRHPLTDLPGTVALNAEMDRLLQRQQSFVVAYADLDHFKPFNDAYGYSRGDQLILHLAQLMRGIASPQIDLLAHVGGDDFLLLMRSRDWPDRLTRLVGMFDATIDTFYDEGDRVTGGIAGEDRDGRPCRFRLAALSIGVVDPRREALTSVAAVADRLQALKREAKRRVGSGWVAAEGGGVAARSGRAALESTAVPARCAG